MKIDKVDGREYWMVEHPDDLLSWEIEHAEPWKEGVTRLHARRISQRIEARLLYCPNAILKSHTDLQFGSLNAEVILEDILGAEYITED